jgi:hypothetical protein
MEFMVSEHRPDTQRRRKTVQVLKKVRSGSAVALEDITEKDDQVRMQVLHLCDACIQPLLAEQRTQMKVGDGYHHCAVEAPRESPEGDLVVSHHGRPHPLHDRDD